MPNQSNQTLSRLDAQQLGVVSENKELLLGMGWRIGADNLTPPCRPGKEQRPAYGLVDAQGKIERMFQGRSSPPTQGLFHFRSTVYTDDHGDMTFAVEVAGLPQAARCVLQATFNDLKIPRVG